MPLLVVVVGLMADCMYDIAVVEVAMAVAAQGVPMVVERMVVAMEVEAVGVAMAVVIVRPCCSRYCGCRGQASSSALLTMAILTWLYLLSL